MKKIMDKLLSKYKKHQKLILFLEVIMVTGFVFGSIFIKIISKSDKVILEDYLINFFSNLSSNKFSAIDCLKNSLFSNISLAIFSFTLGMSIIGIPLNIFILFIKSFTLGFSISTFIYFYKFKGILYSFIYIFPSYLLNLASFFIIVIFSINFSIYFLHSLKIEKKINFRLLFYRYSIITIFSILLISMCSLYESFIIPLILNKIA